MATPGLIATKQGKKNVQFKLLGGSTTLRIEVFHSEWDHHPIVGPFFSQDILQTNCIQQWYLGVGHRAHKASHLQAGWNGYILLDKFMLFHELDMIFGFGTCNFEKPSEYMF